MSVQQFWKAEQAVMYERSFYVVSQTRLLIVNVFFPGSKAFLPFYIVQILVWGMIVFYNMFLHISR